VGDDEDLVNRLKKRSLDLAVSHIDLSLFIKTDIHSHLAAQIPVWLVAKPGIKASFGKSSAGGALPVLLRPTSNPVRKQVDRALSDLGFRASIQAEAEDADLLRLLALKGAGAAALTADSVQDDIKAGRLVKLTSKPVALQQIWLIYHTPELVGPLLGKDIQHVFQTHA
jgi:DNA-binding transcriptional LysR family regulator